jgi:hypothetical protein
VQRDTRALSMWDDDQARKGEITARMNERDHPHVVEPALPSGGFRPSSDEMQAFHRERGVESRARAAAAVRRGVRIVPDRQRKSGEGERASQARPLRILARSSRRMRFICANRISTFLRREMTAGMPPCWPARGHDRAHPR